jgi:hypothetical protein
MSPASPPYDAIGRVEAKQSAAAIFVEIPAKAGIRYFAPIAM